MEIKAVYHYSDDDEDFSCDCYQTEVFINGREIELPFEDDYPKQLTQVFVKGILFMKPDAVLIEEEVADLP